MNFVDLGLSVKWASCNVGADTPTAFGEYFTFKEAQKIEKPDGSRLPTYEELTELVNACDWRMIGNYAELKGAIVVRPNEQSIFIPAAGNGTEWTVGQGLDLWSGEEIDFGEAHSLHLRIGSVYTEAANMRQHMSVRLVKD